LGVLVGSEILGVWVVPSGGGCADATAVLKDETGNILSSTNIPSGTSQDIIAPDGVATAKNSEGTILSTLSIDSGGAGDLNIGDSSAVIKDSGGNILKTELIPAETSSDVLINDSSVDNSDASYSVLVLAEGNLVLPDSQINVNSVDIGDVVSVKTIDVNLSDGVSPIAPVSSILTGNTLAIEILPVLKDIELNYVFNSGESESALSTIDSFSAGTYTSQSQDGASGTITISINGGGYTAFSSPLVLIATDTIKVKRTTTTGAGWVKLIGTYV
jgi:hypothetical protein